MPIMAIYRSAGVDREDFDRYRALAPIEPAPEAGIVHQVAFDDTGIVVVEVWEDEAALRTYYAERIRPALIQAGLPPVEPQILDIHALWVTKDADRRNVAAPEPKEAAALASA